MKSFFTAVSIGSPGFTYCAYPTCDFIVTGPVDLTGIVQSYPYLDSAVLLQWDGACSGAGSTCSLNVTRPAQIGAHFQSLNLAFTTSPVQISTFGTDGSGADAACNAAALALGYEQPFVAWLAATNRNPAALLAGSNGWRVGSYYLPIQVFAPNVAALTSARPWSGLTGTSAVVVTGADVDGNPLAPSQTCQNWTATTGVTPAGTIGAMGYAWSNDPGVPPIPCNRSASLVCLGVGKSGAVATSYLPDSGVTFVSSPWIPSNGLSGADSQCQIDANDAGYTGSFVASELHGMTQTPTPPDLRADNATVTDADNVDALGIGIVANTLPETYLWTAGTRDCNAWAGGAGQLGSIRRFDLGSPALVPPSDACTEAHRLVCLQVQ